MIIVSQDKEIIINFDKVIAISTSEGKIGVSGDLRDVDFCLIGEYQTEERAKEVLVQILGKYKECNRFGAEGIGFVANNIFYMPKE